LKSICILGGGVHVLNNVKLLADQIDDRELGIRIVARDLRRLDAIGTSCVAVLAGHRPDWEILTTADRAAGLDGADVVMGMIRVGGLAARCHDESFPAEIDQIGDEGIGLGGISNTWRTLPFMETLRADIAARAPSATVLNLTAPLATTTRCLTEQGRSTWGVCELPYTSQRALGPSAKTMTYGGLNHLGWFCPANDVEWAAIEHAVSAGNADRATVERFGALPLHYYYRLFDPAAATRLDQAFVPGRAQALGELVAEAEQEMREHPSNGAPTLARRKTPWFDHALVPITSALLGYSTHRAFANASMSTFSETPFPAETVVETRASWCDTGASADPFPRLPGKVTDFLLAVATSDDLAYRAAMERDTTLLRKALEALPLEMRSREVEYAVKQIVAGGNMGAPDRSEPEVDT